MAEAESFISQLGHFATHPAARSLSQNDDQRVRAMALDWLGCAIAGASTAPARLLLGALPGRSEGGTAIGTRARLDTLNSALFNGTAGHVLDFDDTEFVGETHPSTVILPAVFAVGEEQTAPLRDVLDAAVVGYRILRPLGAVLNPEHYARGWHATGTIGALAATAAVAALRGLGEESMARALAVSATAAAGQQVSFGTMAKPLNAGRAAMQAVLSVRLAEGGYTAPLDAFEGRGGLFALMGSEPSRAELLRRELARREHPLDWIRFKEFPTCHNTHAALFAARTVLSRNMGKRVASVDIGLSEYAHGMVSVRAPRTEAQARFSQTYAVATMIQRSTIGLADLSGERLTDPDIRATETMIVCTLRPGLADMEARVSMTFTDGTKDAETGLITRDGAIDLPESLEEKFRSNLQSAQAGLDADSIVSGLHGTLPQPVKALLSLTVPEGAKEQREREPH